MRDCGCWVVCGGLLVAQLGCGGDAAPIGRGNGAVPAGEPGEEPTPAAPVAPGEALTPAEGETPVPGEPATAGEPSPFNPSPTDSTCVAVPDFVVATPLNDTRGTGFSALDMLTIFNEQGPGTLTWLDGTTTTLGIQASAAADTSEVDDPPRGEGYCVPVRQLPIQLRIESADGRLAEDVACKLIAAGYDGHVDSIWVAEGYVPLEELQGDLEVPGEWIIASHTERRIELDTAWSPPGGLGPFCAEPDMPSTDPAESCNVYSGVVRFFSSTPYSIIPADPADAIEINPSFERFRGVLGSWVLAR
jgi:hypothetical protein